MSDLSPSQQSALSALRGRIADVATPRCTDVYLLRFLRSRGFDLDATERKLRDTLEFRRKWGADTILMTSHYTPPPLLVRYFPTGVLEGSCRAGYPVPVLPLGQLDLRGLMRSHTREDLLRYKVYEMESMEELLARRTAEEGRPVDRVTTVLDLHGMGSHHLWRPGIALFTEFMDLEERHYPEVVHKGLFVRAPPIFGVVLRLIRPFVDPHTREKLEVLSGPDWQKRLLEFVPPEVLPEVYGGTAKETPRVCWGGVVPRELYRERDVRLQAQVVRPCSRFTLEVPVARAGAELAWEFLTEGFDIGFAVSFRAAAPPAAPAGSVAVDIEVLVPPERVASHLCSVEGAWTSEGAGVFVLEWDNSYSWGRAKTLRYRHEVKEPEAGPGGQGPQEGEVVVVEGGE